MKTLVGAVDPWDRQPSGAAADHLEHPLEDAELVLGRPLRVFRQWRLSGDCLYSLNGVPWPDPTSVATCGRGASGLAGRITRSRGLPTTDSVPHAAPDPWCSCGFYAFYKPGHDVRAGPRFVFGAAEVSGTLVCAELGVRAERMRIRALTALPNGIGCWDGVREYDSPAALLADYPPDPAWGELLRG